MAEDISAQRQGSEGEPSRRRGAYKRAWIPPLVAVALLLAAHFLFGAARPMSALFLSGCLIVSGVVTLAFAGPRYATAGMLIVAAVIWGFGLIGWAGSLDLAAPHLAVLTAAGAMWATGYVCARQRGALDIAWTGLIWSSLVFCLYAFFRHVARSFGSEALTGATGLHAAAGLDSPAAASVLFGLFAILGAGRVLHVVKQIDAEGVSRSETVDRLLSRGLGGLLLLGFAATCLVLTGSRVGMLFAASALLLHTWWDSRAIIDRPHRGKILVWLAYISPFLAIGLAGLGLFFAYVRDDSAAFSAIAGDDFARIQRLQTYFAAFLQKPVFGHGFGSLDEVRDAGMNLHNASALLVDGGPQNVVLSWLVQGGGAAFLAAFAVVAAMHVALARSLGIRRQPRTFLRLSLISSFFLLLHGVTDSSIDLPAAIWLYALIIGAGCGVAAAQRSSSGERTQ